MATAAVGSCFSAASVAPCRLSRHAHSDAAIVRITPLRGARSLHLAELDVARRRRLPSIRATVVQEGTAEEATSEQEGDVVPSIRAAVVQEGAAEEATAEQEGDVVPAPESEPEPKPELVQNTKLYFGNLPYNCDSAQLAGIVQEYASPEMVEVLYDRDTGRSRGFAFVTMSSVEDCKAVIQNLDGSQYGGRTLRVNFSDKPKPKEPLYPESEYKLFVGNLSWSVTSESLLQVFQEYGNVVGARVLYDGDTGQSRGYGFVCYSTKQEMDAAVETLNGVELEGRAMRISLALGKRS